MSWKRGLGLTPLHMGAGDVPSRSPRSAAGAGGAGGDGGSTGASAPGLPAAVMSPSVRTLVSPSRRFASPTHASAADGCAVCHGKAALRCPCGLAWYCSTKHRREFARQHKLAHDEVLWRREVRELGRQADAAREEAKAAEQLREDCPHAAAEDLPEAERAAVLRLRELCGECDALPVRSRHITLVLRLCDVVKELKPSLASGSVERAMWGAAFDAALKAPMYDSLPAHLAAIEAGGAADCSFATALLVVTALQGSRREAHRTTHLDALRHAFVEGGPGDASVWEKLHKRMDSRQLSPSAALLFWVLVAARRFEQDCEDRLHEREGEPQFAEYAGMLFGVLKVLRGSMDDLPWPAPCACAVARTPPKLTLHTEFWAKQTREFCREQRFHAKDGSLNATSAACAHMSETAAGVASSPSAAEFLERPCESPMGRATFFAEKAEERMSVESEGCAMGLALRATMAALQARASASGSADAAAAEAYRRCNVAVSIRVLRGLAPAELLGLLDEAELGALGPDVALGRCLATLARTMDYCRCAADAEAGDGNLPPELSAVAQEQGDLVEQVLEEWADELDEDYEDDGDGFGDDFGADE